MSAKFVKMPREAFMDARLTLEQLRVLGALLSFRNKDDEEVFPSRQAISERCGIHPSNISAATSALEGLGWLVKMGRGGHSKASRYTLTVPGTIAQSATVRESETVAEQATDNPSPSGYGSRIGNGSPSSYALPLAESATRKEVDQGRDQVGAAREKRPETTLMQFLESCRAQGVDALPEDDRIFAYAKTVGISREMVATQWHVFKEKYLETGKREKDWPATFRNAVRNAWYGLWRIHEGQSAVWTTAGQQARIASGVGFQRDAA